MSSAIFLSILGCGIKCWLFLSVFFNVKILKVITIIIYDMRLLVNTPNDLTCDYHKAVVSNIEAEVIKPLILDLGIN